jgi:hypothetical protein
MKIERIKKQSWGAVCAAAMLCAAAVLAPGCNNAKIKSEAETAAEHLKQAGHETVEATKAAGRAAEAAGKEVVDKAAEEGEKLREKVDGAAGSPSPGSENPVSENPGNPNPPGTPDTK